MRWWSSEMSQLSRTLVPPSTGSSSYRQMRPPMYLPRRPWSRACQAMRRFSSNSMTVLTIEYFMPRCIDMPKVAPRESRSGPPGLTCLTAPEPSMSG